MAKHRPMIMVSSTVYYQQSFLDQVFASLETFGYTVWMSHAGTLPVNPGLSNFRNCELAVDACDVFLGIITGWYGSGEDKNTKSITHREMDRAISKERLAWFLVHHDVVVARQLLQQYKPNPRHLQWKFPFKSTAVLEDLRVLQMYEKAMRHDVPLKDRRGNWVQEFYYSQDALRFIDSQLSDTERVLSLLEKRRAGGKQ